MKKYYLTVACIAALGCSMMLQSCIGSFALTNKVLKWNKQVGSKFVNELVFFAFWILPVYEVTGLADILVINSIEFWSGSNPLTASTKAVIGEDGERYLIACDGKGYTITNENTKEAIRMDFNEDTQTWSWNINGEDVPFMTFVDENHVKMISPSGDMNLYELNENGVMAYSHNIQTATASIAQK